MEEEEAWYRSFVEEVLRVDEEILMMTKKNTKTKRTTKGRMSDRRYDRGGDQILTPPKMPPPPMSLSLFSSEYIRAEAASNEGGEGER